MERATEVRLCNAVCVYTVQSLFLWFIPAIAAQPLIMPLTPGLYLHSHLWHICRWGYCKPCDWWLCGWRCKRTRSQINSSPFFSFLSIQLSSISKAINSAETPVKEKHARRILKIKQTNRQLLFRSVVCAWLLYNLLYGLKCKILILESLFWG